MQQARTPITIQMGNEYRYFQLYSLHIFIQAKRIGLKLIYQGQYGQDQDKVWANCGGWVDMGLEYRRDVPGAVF